MSVISFRIREELQGPLEQAAAQLRRPKAWIINEALASYFERENQEQRMHRETLEGLADVEAGRVIDGEKVTAWIKSWGSDSELPPPKVRSCNLPAKRWRIWSGCTSSLPRKIQRPLIESDHTD